MTLYALEAIEPTNCSFPSGSLLPPAPSSVLQDLLIRLDMRSQGPESGPFGTGCVNTISKEMGPFSASSEWNEWINFHSKWVSYQPIHSLWVHFALLFHSIWAIFSPFNMGYLQHKYSFTTMCRELCFALSEHNYF